MAKPLRNFFSWDTRSPLYGDFIVILDDAFNKGYSVVELTRILGTHTCENLYKLMRTESILPCMPRGRKKNPPAVPVGLEPELKKFRLTYGQWCTSHGLNPGTTSAALHGAENPLDPLSVAAHTAWRVDFTASYCKAFGLPVPPASAPKPKITHYALTIVPRIEEEVFEAYVHDLPGCRVTGKSRDAAYHNLKRQYVFISSIGKLKDLPSKARIYRPEFQ